MCTGAARLSTDDAAVLATLIVDGVADAAAATAVPALPPSRPGLAGVVDRLRWFVRGTVPADPTPAKGSGAVVRPLRRRSA